MKSLWLAFSLIGMVGVAACASMKVDTSFQQGTDFAAYETFSWMETSREVQDNLSRLGKATERIEQAIETKLLSDGYRKDVEDPDFLVVYHASVDRVITGATIDTWGYRYRRPALRRGGIMIADVDVESYGVGTLVVDIVDAETDELVWRGTATDAVDGPRQAASKIDEAVEKILSAFPPGS